MMLHIDYVEYYVSVEGIWALQSLVPEGILGPAPYGL